jgi:hypothetical protein
MFRQSQIVVPMRVAFLILILVLGLFYIFSGGNTIREISF